MSQQSSKVLVVDDERGLADLYSAWIESEYEVRTAYGGESALAQVDAETDVVLLDRRMPDRTGGEVLEEIRARELSCHVCMVTAVEPDFDIVAMGFDDYVVKPVEREELHALVERMLAFDDLGPGAKQYHASVSKKTALESEKPSSALENNSEFTDLSASVDAYGSMIVSLAEAAVTASHRDQIMGRDQTEVTVELRKWESRLESMDKGDPLYQVAKERLTELRSERREGGTDAKQKFLETVADGFIAEGRWLDPTVQRALNLIVHNKDSESFIVDRQAIADLAERGPSEKFDVSQTIRDYARRELG